ncbi:MAG: aminobenzoyl-glutamate utilization protein [Clostridia bacterium]|jgi:aminobenzoyl-glutamate utilization protein A|nr:aminobenzoyl-glutamate utilization protein [Clostridia bacterium]MDN5321854.1 aminobenzoyl-glutamate utilization protein [Clostridia bacterium]
MEGKIKDLVKKIEAKTIERRRDFHKYAEVAWTEFRTAAKVADVLQELGYEVLAGDDVIAPEAMMGVPEPEKLERHVKRALAQGANPKWVEKMKGGKTGVVGIMDFQKPGPTLAFRFDMDANDAIEAEEEEHRPYRENFASVNKGAMHACGHDGHTAIGLAVAEILTTLKDQLAGKIKLIFQPAEEGVRGAKAMMVKGVVDDVDYLVGLHLGFAFNELGKISCDAGGFLATTKLDVTFTGHPAHAGGAPETGRNALLAASTALVNLYAISRHSQGPSRINVGILEGGTGRNVIPARAVMKLETRGATSTINEYMYNEAIRIIKAAGDMHGVKVKIAETGGAAGANSNPELGERIKLVAQRMELFEEYIPAKNLGGSEDVTYFMERVQQKGGMAAYVIVGTELAAGHHDFRFDFNEEALSKSVALLSGVAVDILTGEK